MRFCQSKNNRDPLWVKLVRETIEDSGPHGFCDPVEEGNQSLSVIKKAEANPVKGKKNVCAQGA
jgi:hypothetical protein